MQVILLEKIVNLGGLGDVVRVKDGFARNFLIPSARHAALPKPRSRNSKPSALNWKRPPPRSWQLPKPKAKS